MQLARDHRRRGVRAQARSAAPGSISTPHAASISFSTIERAPPTVSTPTGWPTMSLQDALRGIGGADHASRDWACRRSRRTSTLTFEIWLTTEGRGRHGEVDVACDHRARAGGAGVELAQLDVGAVFLEAARRRRRRSTTASAKIGGMPGAAKTSFFACASAAPAPGPNSRSAARPHFKIREIIFIVFLIPCADPKLEFGLARLAHQRVPDPLAQLGKARQARACRGCAGRGRSIAMSSSMRLGRPFSTMTRSPISTASSIEWVTNTIVVGRRSQMRRSSNCRISRVCASTAANGSSISSTRGSIGERTGQAAALLHAARHLIGIGLLEAGQGRRASMNAATRRAISALGGPPCAARRRRCRTPSSTGKGRNAGTPWRRRRAARSCARHSTSISPS